MNDLPPFRLDEIDQALLAALIGDGRISNAELARRVGLAESSCLKRVRALRAARVITGIHAHVDPTRLGRPIQAIVTVRLRENGRGAVHSVRDHVATLPGVLTAFHVSGSDDYLVHVAVQSSEALRDLVLYRIASHPAVRHTETQLVLEISRGRLPLDDQVHTR